MKSVRTLAVTALSTAVIAGGLSLGAATSASADPISGGVSQDGEDSADTSAQADDAGSTGGIDDPDDLTSEQIDNAKTIIAVGKGADLSKKAQKIAVMTALQESSLRNLDGGDKDSVGLFQQRPSMDWGSAKDLTDPVYAAKAFYGVDSETANPGLTEVDEDMSMKPGDAAQKVQSSAYPDAYAKWESLAGDLVDDHQKVDSID
ncbi:hypothetical protein [Brevibacterium atlanticum]|uniref:hypothetical protein n=1 Tax=Brevibacterium atlanticum TaxID=2697563 RepID=UPI0014215754|nr:hypothetical protein [Brevibacterium atlanticum]